MLRFYKPRLQGSRAPIFALLCIALVIIGGTIQIAHTHSFDHLAHPEYSE